MGHRCRAWPKTPAAPTSHGSPHTSHPPTSPKQAAATGHRCQAQAPPQRAAPTSNHGHTPRLQRLPTPSRPQPTMKVGARRVSSLPSHVPDAAASTSRSKTRLHASSRRQEAKNNHRGDIEATTKSKHDAFRKVATPMAPPSHVQSGSGFHPWMIVLEGIHDAPNRESGTHRCRRR